ncbi:MAG: hypothetical protein ACRC62_17125 [Microcoleus sp.]
MFDFGNESFDSSLAMEGDQSGSRYPAIMADDYKPKNLKTAVKLGLTQDGIDLLSDISGLLLPEQIEVSYNDGKVEEIFQAFAPGVRWVILAQPRLFAINKETGDISKLAKGMSERGEVSISKVLLACLVGGTLLLDEEGLPQIFTLKLKSSKTSLIGNSRDKDGGVKDNKGKSTIAALNNAVRASCKGAAKNAWVAHLASVELGAIAELFESKPDAKGKTQSSMGIRFVFGEGAKKVPDAAAKQIVEFISTEEFKTFALNPFAKPAEKEPEEHNYEFNIEGDESGLGF